MPNYEQPTEGELRRRAEKKIKARQNFYSHLTAYILINLFLLGAWVMAGADFSSFWPAWVILGWGVGLIAHGINYNNNYGAGKYRQDSLIAREVERERQRLMDRDKQKNEDYFQ